MSDTKVKVAVRVRPMNRREIELSTKCVVEMEENQTILHPPPSNAKGENRYKTSFSLQMMTFTHHLNFLHTSTLAGRMHRKQQSISHISIYILDQCNLTRALYF
ncbi:hypothetical protein PGIGA_G00131020 [Pangasianodon gigas]|uniref:Uncharacterized protein n=1 Tax=Pangasianodon gigas TaxID=30993 RepID=A0ACC5XJP1_PANGG|nr:hypothetical protein [Pangasianodon gigas]